MLNTTKLKFIPSNELPAANCYFIYDFQVSRHEERWSHNLAARGSFPIVRRNLLCNICNLVRSNHPFCDYLDKKYLF
jgi:hypothetical protein